MHELDRTGDTYHLSAGEATYLFRGGDLLNLVEPCFDFTRLPTDDADLMLDLMGVFARWDQAGGFSPYRNDPVARYMKHVMNQFWGAMREVHGSRNSLWNGTPLGERCLRRLTERLGASLAHSGRSQDVMVVSLGVGRHDHVVRAEDVFDDDKVILCASSRVAAASLSGVDWKYPPLGVGSSFSYCGSSSAWESAEQFIMGFYALYAARWISKVSNNHVSIVDGTSPSSPSFSRTGLLCLPRGPHQILVFSANMHRQGEIAALLR